MALTSEKVAIAAQYGALAGLGEMGPEVSVTLPQHSLFSSGCVVLFIRLLSGQVKRLNLKTCERNIKSSMICCTCTILINRHTGQDSMIQRSCCISVATTVFCLKLSQHLICDLMTVVHFNIVHECMI